MKSWGLCFAKDFRIYFSYFQDALNKVIFFRKTLIFAFYLSCLRERNKNTKGKSFTQSLFSSQQYLPLFIGVLLELGHNLVCPLIFAAAFSLKIFVWNKLSFAGERYQMTNNKSLSVKLFIFFSPERWICKLDC